MFNADAARGKSGIYRIFHIHGNPGDEYIGQSDNIHRRWMKHLNTLRRGCNSAHLQSAWDLYGADAFGWEVLEVVTDLTQLTAREQYYMDTRKPRYNLRPTAHCMLGYHHTPATRDKLRILTPARLAAYAARRGRALSPAQYEAIRKASKTYAESRRGQPADAMTRAKLEKARASHAQKRREYGLTDREYAQIVEAGHKSHVASKLRAATGNYTEKERAYFVRKVGQEINETQQQALARGREIGIQVKRDQAAARIVQIKAVMLDAIVARGWGTTLPDMMRQELERTFAEQTGLTPNAVWQAIKLLLADGAITRGTLPPLALPTPPIQAALFD